MPKIELKQYKTLIFDCDGVILNSNKIKTQAFYDVAKIYGHVKRGRYPFFKFSCLFMGQIIS